MLATLSLQLLLVETVITLGMKGLVPVLQGSCLGVVAVEGLLPLLHIDVVGVGHFPVRLRILVPWLGWFGGLC